MGDYDKPVPVPDDLTGFYWEYAKRHRLAIQRCQDCGTYIHWPQPLCRNCLSDTLAPEEVSGRGTVYSYTVTDYIFHPGFAGEIPYVVAVIALEEDPGVHIVSNLIDCPRDEVAIGLPVEVVFQDVTHELTLPQFRPRSDARPGR